MLIEEEAAPESAEQYPETWTPIVPNGKRCKVTGLGHSKLYQILGPEGIAKPYVRTASLKPGGAIRGTTIFHVGDMLRWLNKKAAESAGGQAQ